MGKGTAQHALCCPCGRPEILALGLCASCYTMKRQDEAYFGGLREAVLARDGYRCRGCGASGSRETQDHRASSRPWRLPVGTDDLAVSGVPCQGGGYEDGARGDDTAAAGAVARATPGRARTSHVGFQRERASNSSSAAGIRRSSKRNCEAWRVNVPELIERFERKVLLVATEGRFRAPLQTLRQSAHLSS